jgi:hypothetical protein
MARLTQSKAESVAELVMQGHSLVSACKEARISRSVLYKKMGEDAGVEVSDGTVRIVWESDSAG